MAKEIILTYKTFVLGGKDGMPGEKDSVSFFTE